MISYNYAIGVDGCVQCGFDIIKILSKYIQNSLLVNKNFKKIRMVNNFKEF